MYDVLNFYWTASELQMDRDCLKYSALTFFITKKNKVIKDLVVPHYSMHQSTHSKCMSLFIPQEVPHLYHPYQGLPKYPANIYADALQK